MCWICNMKQPTTHIDQDKWFRKYFEPKMKYNEEFSKAGYYDSFLETELNNEQNK